MTARAISIRQPWAWAITDLDKRVENRTRKYAYRGELFLHASATLCASGGVDYLRELLSEPETARLGAVEDLPRGAIVGVCTFVRCQETFLVNESPVIPSASGGSRTRPDQARWAEAGAWWLVLDNVRKLPEPVPCRGMLGLWPVPVDVERRVREQLAVNA